LRVSLAALPKIDSLSSGLTKDLAIWPGECGIHSTTHNETFF